MVCLAPGTFEAKVLQYIMPNGDVRRQTADLPLYLKPMYDDMRHAGFRVAAEVLLTSQVAVYIESIHDQETVDIEVVSNTEAVLEAMAKMLRRARWRNRE
jgi:hypothetical protein